MTFMLLKGRSIISVHVRKLRAGCAAGDELALRGSVDGRARREVRSRSMSLGVGDGVGVSGILAGAGSERLAIARESEVSVDACTFVLLCAEATAEICIKFGHSGVDTRSGKKRSVQTSREVSRSCPRVDTG